MKKTATYFCLALALTVMGACTSTKSHDEEVEEALRFLYASMPLPDSVDYPRDFWVQNIECALQAREEMPWGKDIPEREWKHFVLPVRVNNENMDSARVVFYHELKTRLEGMTMEEAVLEVNHWCHEHVTYTPSDERTSSPLATIRTAYGRCGEESTLLVAALRSVGIPARQVYTPRWAHTDDNHAWVEAWVDGEWHFLGACEPEPVLDLGWFNAPASRSMLMHTKAFGAYDGWEDVMDRTACYTEIAVTRGYAPVSRRYVKVVDSKGKPVEGAKVEYKIYNYAEFYTFCSKIADQHGLSSVEAGLGDLVVWATDGTHYGFARCTMTETDTLLVALSHQAGDCYSMDLEIVPPKERNTVPDMTEEQRQHNAQRLAEEDKIRQAYEATFPTEAKAKAWAEAEGLPADRVAPLILASRGNYACIEEFLGERKDERAILLLESLAAKDLRDVSLEVLLDHHTLGTPTIADSVAQTSTKVLQEVAQQIGQNMEARDESTLQHYILCPRVANEMLTPYRSYLLQEMPADLQRTLAQEGPQAVMAWVKANIGIDEDSNPQHLRMMPTGVWRHRVTDSRSRDIFFVALCRTLGHPARIDAVTGKVQYLTTEGWTDVAFEAETEETGKATGKLQVSWTPLSWMENPKYYTHFTLSQIKSGRAQLMNYPDEGTWQTTLRTPQTLDEGDYMLISGTRMADGSVLVHLECQPLRADSLLTMPLQLRQPEEGLQVIGNLNSEARYFPLEADEVGKPLSGEDRWKDSEERAKQLKSLLSTTGRGYYILGIIAPSNEPTNHTLRDIAAVKEQIDEWGGHLVLLFRSASDAERFQLEGLPTLPQHTHFGIDATGAIYDELLSGLRLSGTAPTFVIADTFNRVVFLSEGYTIGLGERLARNLGSIKP